MKTKPINLNKKYHIVIKQFIVVCNKKRKPNQNTTKARIVIAGAGVVLAGAQIIITGARIIIVITPYVLWRKIHKNRFLLALLLVFFIGKIRNEEKNTDPCNSAWFVSVHLAKDPVPQIPVLICGLRKSRYSNLENHVPIPYHDSFLRTRPAVQIHNYHL